MQFEENFLSPFPVRVFPTYVSTSYIEIPSQSIILLRYFAFSPSKILPRYVKITVNHNSVINSELEGTVHRDIENTL